MQVRQPAVILAEIRERAGLDKQGLALLGGVHPSVIGRWEAGQTVPGAVTLRSVSDGIKRARPELAALADELYDSVYGPQAVPDVVRDSWADVNVRTFWSLKVSVARRLAYIETYLADEEAEHESGAPAANHGNG